MKELNKVNKESRKKIKRRQQRKGEFEVGK